MFTAATLAELRHALSAQPRPLVVALCAQWCGTCREFRNTFRHLKQQFPHAEFFWLDVEDDAELAGDLDIHDFPSLAIYDASGTPLYFGTSLPQIGVVVRLLTTQLNHPAPLSDPPPEALALYQTLVARVE